MFATSKKQSTEQIQKFHLVYAHIVEERLYGEMGNTEVSMVVPTILDASLRLSDTE